MTDKPIRVDGFVIVPPLSPWDRRHRNEIWAYMSPSSFATTAAEAWRRHHFKPDAPEPGEFSQLVQYWFGLGYRVKRAALEIFPEDDKETDHDHA